MNPQLQLWMPAVLSLFGALIVVVLTAWLNTRMLSAQVESIRSELRAEIQSVRTELRAEMRALEERIGRQLAELELRLTTQISELSHRIERLEEARGLGRA